MSTEMLALPSVWLPYWHLTGTLQQVKEAVEYYGGTLTELNGQWVCKMPQDTPKATHEQPYSRQINAGQQWILP